MLAYSYKVEVKRLEALIKKCEWRLAKNSKDATALKTLPKAKADKAWYESELKKGVGHESRII